MAQRRTYAIPPLVEALCEIHFAPGQEWDWTVPGLLYAQLQKDYPRKEQAEQVEVQWGDNPSQVHRQTSRRLRFFNEHKTALVQVGKDLLVFNQLHPYPGWDLFRSMLVSALERYKAVAAPSGVAACALRYLNRLSIPQESATLEDYLLAVPSIPKNLPQTLVGWSLSLDIPHEVRKGVMHLEAGSAPSQGTGRVAFVLDLRFQAISPKELGLDDGLLEWVDGAHEIIEETFEASITDQARSLFEELIHDQLASR